VGQVRRVSRHRYVRVSLHDSSTPYLDAINGDLCGLEMSSFTRLKWLLTTLLSVSFTSLSQSVRLACPLHCDNRRRPIQTFRPLPITNHRPLTTSTTSYTRILKIPPFSVHSLQTATFVRFFKRAAFY